MNRNITDNSTLNFYLNSGAKLLDYSTPESSYEMGINCLCKSRYEEASRCFRAVIAAEGNNADAHYHLAYSYQLLDKFEEALNEYRRTLELNPCKTDALINSGIILSDHEKYDESEKCFRLVLKINPSETNALINLGNLKFRLKQYEEAVFIYSKVLETGIKSPSACYNLGNIYFEMSEYEKATQSYYSALILEPRHFGAITNLGLIYYKQGILDKALGYFNKALELSPEHALTYFNIANIYRSLKKNEIALIYYRQAIEKDSKIRMSYVYIADILFEQGKEEEARNTYNIATGDKASRAVSFTNLGIEMMENLRFKEAERYFDVALTVNEDIPEVHYNKAYIYLIEGQFEKGWQEYEWRLKRPDNKQPDFNKPFLKEESVKDRRILVTDEQGFGDSIQFVRYLSLLKQKGAYVIFECKKNLLPLFKNLGGVDELIEKKKCEVPPVEFDYHVPLMSLPKYFGTNLYNIPGGTPYIIPDPHLVEYWGKKIKNKSRLNVGIVWGGSPQNTNDKKRSVHLKEMMPLFDLGGIDFYSLQKGEALKQISALKTPVNVFEEFDKVPFIDSAAIIKNLDLIVTVDTSIAHLAGALGKPVWVLLPYLPDWRWLLVRQNSPWYPSLKLFRQQKVNDWNKNILEIKNQLNEIANPDLTNYPSGNLSNKITGNNYKALVL